MMRSIFFIWLVVFSIESKGQGNSFTSNDSSGTATKKSAKHALLYPAIATGYIGLTYFTYRHFDQEIKESWQNNRSHFQTLISKSVTNLGLGKTQAIELAATATAAFLLKKKKLQATVITWAGGLVINSTVTDQLKKTFQRHRPNTGDAYNVFDWRGGPHINNSFPSAHTSNAFCTATVFATIYSNHKWVPPVAYGLATLVGLSRIYDNAHWASDVLAGALIGFASAKASHFLYKKACRKFTWLPSEEGKHFSITLVYQL